MRAARIRVALTGARAKHGLHGMHGLLAGWVTPIILVTVLATSAAAVEPTTIPTAPTGTVAPRCTVGQSCTFAAPIFACDSSSA